MNYIAFEHVIQMAKCFGTEFTNSDDLTCIPESHPAGTWHRKLSVRGRPLRWTRHALAQAAGACVLWDAAPEGEPQRLRPVASGA